MKQILHCCLLLAVVGARAVAEDVATAKAVARATALIAASTERYTEERECFSCHHQALAVMTLQLADARGLGSASSAAMRKQSEFTHGYFAERREDVAAGKRVNGGPYEAGYALLQLKADAWPADEVTTALVDYLRETQKDDGSWRIRTHRPPLEDSHFTATALAVRSLSLFAGEGEDDDAQRRIERGREWLTSTPAETTEDYVFKLFGLRWADASADAIQQAAEALKKRADSDGGWAQSSDRTSDAYATGQALVALHLAGGMKTDDPAYRAGIEWLLDEQHDDGSWLVPSHANPFQTYFESGFPHEKSQFISMAGTCWATMAIALTRDAKADALPSPLEHVESNGGD
jgi:hypothetical protein